MYTLSNVLYDCLKQIGKIKTRTATGGSTTTAIDSGLSSLELSDGDYVGGYLFVQETTDGLAPKGEFKKISAFVASTGTFTTASFSAAIGAGDTIGYITNPFEYVLEDIIHGVNMGLRQLGTIDVVDTATLTTADEKTEYAASVDWKYNKPKRIDFQTVTTDSDNNEWVETKAWDWIPAAPGSTGLIIFKEQPDSGNKIRVWYEGVHPELVTYDDIISETVHPTLAQLSCLERILFTKNAEKNGSDQTVKEMYNWASESLEKAKSDYATIKEKHKDIGLITKLTDWRIE